jgi:hypothetical protein
LRDLPDPQCAIAVTAGEASVSLRL